MRNQKCRIFFIGIFLVFSLSFFTTVYAQSPIELKVATWNPPPPFPPSTPAEKWAKMVEEKSGGAVKIVFYWAGGLASLRDTYRTVQTGVAEIGFWVPGVLPGLHTLSEYTNLPLLGGDGMVTATKVYHEMRKKFPQIDAEFKGLRLLAANSMAPNQYHFTKLKSVRVPDDMKGIKVIGSASNSEFIKHCGAVSVFKPPSDYYMSLQKGLVQAAFQHWPFINAFKLEELFSSHTDAGDAGFNHQMMGFWMNLDVWNKLPPEAQKAFDDSREWLEQATIKVDTALINKARDAARNAGHPVIDLTAEEKKIWFDATEPIRAKWAADLEAKGKPGKAVYAEAMKLLAKYSQ